MANQPTDNTGAYPARHDTNYSAVQTAVFAKAGFLAPDSDHFANSVRDGQAPPQPVKIRIRSTGLVVSVHHDVAIQKILGNHADLV